LRIVLGVAGGIAAYKAVLLLRLLREAGHEVRVIPTQAALKFVAQPTWEALAGHPVTADVFHGTDTVDHVRFGQQADLVIVAPATANLLAQAASGLATDLLTNTLLTATHAPVLMAPAMHTEMWHHPATIDNVATLRRRGVHVLEPDSGRLTGQDSGPGRLPEPEVIAQVALDLVSSSQGLQGKRVVVSAGGTQEPLDPVRFIGNRSSGHQGVAIAQAAAQAGADVELVACNISADVLPHHPRITTVTARTTLELGERMQERSEADVIFMVAAVADFRPKQTVETKIKKDSANPEATPTIELVENPDILAGLVTNRKHHQVIVGFGAERADAHATVTDLGRAKAIRKGADLLAVNEVGQTRGFGDVANHVHLFNAHGEEVAEISGTKPQVAAGLVDQVVSLLTP